LTALNSLFPSIPLSFTRPKHFNLVMGPGHKTVTLQVSKGVIKTEERYKSGAWGYVSSRCNAGWIPYLIPRGIRNIYCMSINHFLPSKNDNRTKISNLKVEFWMHLGYLYLKGKINHYQS
jgi:hypothetical protein